MSEKRFSFEKAVKAITTGDWSGAKYEKKVMKKDRKERKAFTKKGGLLMSDKNLENIYKHITQS